MSLKNVMQKIAILLLLFFILFPILVLADDEEEEEYNQNEIQDLIVESASSSVEEPKINARAAIIYDRTTKQIIWGKNENEKRRN